MICCAGVLNALIKVEGEHFPAVMADFLQKGGQSPAFLALLSDGLQPSSFLFLVVRPPAATALKRPKRSHDHRGTGETAQRPAGQPTQIHTTLIG